MAEEPAAMHEQAAVVRLAALEGLHLEGSTHVLEDYVVASRVLGKAVGLHPAISIIALVVGADLFGLWGAICAAPLAGIAPSTARRPVALVA